MQIHLGTWNEGMSTRIPIYYILSHDNAPVNIFPTAVGHTRCFRQKTIPNRREIEKKLMESGSRVIDNYYLTASRGI